MKKALILTTIVALIWSCSTEEKRELKGYTFNKEAAVSAPFATDKLLNDLSLDMYVMINSYPTSWVSILSKYDNDKSCEFNLRIKNGEIGQFYYGNGKKTYLLSFITKDILPLNTWVRLTAVRDLKKRELVIYVNGDKVAQKSFKKLPKAKAEKNIMHIATNGKKSLNATFAEIRIWNKALTVSDIKENGGIIKEPKSQKNLFAYWLFDNVQAKKIANLSNAKLDLKIKKSK